MVMDDKVDPSKDRPRFPLQASETTNPVETFVSKAVRPSHPAEADVFSRHDGIPAHVQGALETARVTLVGAGGLNSWAGLALMRSGIGSLTVIDPDTADVSNLSRQYFFEKDLGRPKGIALADNLQNHGVGGTVITGVGLLFEEAIQRFAVPTDIFVVGVDNNACRLECSRSARRKGVPAVFTMLSRDGMRCQSFLQGPSRNDPCLWCALPNLEPDKIMPCASAIISTCLMAAAFSVFFVHRGLMGWGTLTPFNWREADLSGIAPDRTGIVEKRQVCAVCGEFDQ